MLNQFSAVYTQLICCGCPGSVLTTHCGNKTLTSYQGYNPSSYAWLAGLFSVLMFAIATAVATAVYCRRKRRHRGDVDLVRIVHVDDAIRRMCSLRHQQAEERRAGAPLNAERCNEGFQREAETRIDHASGVPQPLSPSQEPEEYAEMVFTMEDPEVGYTLDGFEPEAGQIYEYEQEHDASLVESGREMRQSEEWLLSAGSSDDGLDTAVYSTETQ